MELAAVGVSIAIFNQASRVTIFPLVSITTSFVAEEDTIERMANNNPESKGDNNLLEKESSLSSPAKDTDKKEDAILDGMEKGGNAAVVATNVNETKDTNTTENGNLI